MYYTYLRPNFVLLYSRSTNVQVFSKPFLSTGKASQFYTNSNMAVCRNSTVDLLVIAFFSKQGHILLKLLHANLVLVEKGKKVASCQLFTAFLVRFLVRRCRLGNAYVTVRTNYAQFSGVLLSKCCAHSGWSHPLGIPLP